MILTLFRMAVVPVIVALMIFRPEGWALLSWFLFVTASITDWLDGYLARKLNSVSTMGKLLDPMADKILVSSVLIMFIPLKQIEALAVLLLINRDIIIGGVRSMAASQGHIIAAGPLGKWKTTVQMIAIPCLFLGFDFDFLPFQTIGYYGLWLSVLLSLISGFQYFMGFSRKIFQVQS
ncbi:MAG: CDP-diacylglycerol--glycerol-3-phosphate 3-phosphatidyltransferase [Pseudomonadota bacterium]